MTNQAVPLPIWVEYIRALAPTFVALVAAAIATHIQLQQLRVARVQTKIHMFDRRRSCYVATLRLTGAALARAGLELSELAEFETETIEANFILSGPLLDLTREIRDAAWRIQLIKLEVDDPACAERTALAKEKHDLLIWLSGIRPVLQKHYMLLMRPD